MPKYERATLSAEDRHVLRRWTRGVLVFYGVLALTVIGVATLNYRSVNGPVEQASPEAEVAHHRKQPARALGAGRRRCLRTSFRTRPGEIQHVVWIDFKENGWPPHRARPAASAVTLTMILMAAFVGLSGQGAHAQSADRGGAETIDA